MCVPAQRGTNSMRDTVDGVIGMTSACCDANRHAHLETNDHGAHDGMPPVGGRQRNRCLPHDVAEPCQAREDAVLRICSRLPTERACDIGHFESSLHVHSGDGCLSRRMNDEYVARCVTQHLPEP